MEKRYNEEIDLLYLYRSFKKQFKHFIFLCFKAIDYIKSKWIIILILFIVGVGLGYYRQPEQTVKKEIKLLVRINYNTVDYVYTSVELLNKKIKENDSVFLTTNKINTHNISQLTLTPIIKLKEAAEDFKKYERGLDIILKNIEFDKASKNFELYNTLTSSYKNHILTITIEDKTKDVADVLNPVINFINNSPVAQEIKKTGLLNLKREISTEKETISQIDVILNSYSSNQSLPASLQQMFVVDQNLNPAELIEKKIFLSNNIRLLEETLALADDVLVVLTKPEFVSTKPGIFENKKITYPLILILSFLLIAYLRYLYNKLRKEVYRG